MYRPKDRPYTLLLALQIAKQEERITLWGKIARNAWFNQVQTGIDRGSFYSNRFKK